METAFVVKYNGKYISKLDIHSQSYNYLKLYIEVTDNIYKALNFKELYTGLGSICKLQHISMFDVSIYNGDNGKYICSYGKKEELSVFLGRITYVKCQKKLTIVEEHDLIKKED